MADAPKNLGKDGETRRSSDGGAVPAPGSELPESVLERMRENPDKLAREAVAAVAREDGYKNAVRTEFEAESNWRKAFPKSEKGVSAEQLANQLKRSDLDPRSQGFVRFLSDNFSKIAGITARQPDKNATVSLADLSALGAMNEVDPKALESGASFLKENFFKLSGMDDKVSSERTERMIYDHSFLLFSKEVQEKLNNVLAVSKIADRNPANFAQEKRIHSGFTKEEAERCNPAELTEIARTQALMKGMFGGAVKFEGKSISKTAISQFDEARKRYLELQKNGLDEFLATLQK